MNRRKTGFTLIELLAVLAILGILAALVYPSYARQVVKTRRVEAQLALMEAMQRQEQHRALHHTYVAFGLGAADPDARQFRAWSGHSAAASAYELDGYACPGRDIAQCVELRARPGTANVDRRFADPECGTLTLDSTGAQSSSGATGGTGSGTGSTTAAGCWP